MAGMVLGTACFVLFVYIHLVNHDTNLVSITRGHLTEPYKILCTWVLNTFLVARDKVEQICVCVCAANKPKYLSPVNTSWIATFYHFDN